MWGFAYAKKLILSMSKEGGVTQTPTVTPTVTPEIPRFMTISNIYFVQTLSRLPTVGRKERDGVPGRTQQS